MQNPVIKHYPLLLALSIAINLFCTSASFAQQTTTTTSNKAPSTSNNSNSSNQQDFQQQQNDFGGFGGGGFGGGNGSMSGTRSGGGGGGGGGSERPGFGINFGNFRGFGYPILIYQYVTKILIPIMVLLAIV